MNTEQLQRELIKKESNAEKIVQVILENPGLVGDVISCLSSSSSTARFKSARVLSIISEKNPALLYPYFDFFQNLLSSENNIMKWNSIDILANLAAVDSKNKFNHIYDRYYALLNEGSLITAAHVIENSGKIARAKPSLRKRVAAEIFKVTQIPLPTPECRNILAGKAITTLKNYTELIDDEKAVDAFVKSCLSNTRNATRKKAEEFLRR